MSLQTTLLRVDADLARGDLGKARDRLEGLLGTHPENLEVRRKLGDVFWALRYPERAGQHWYLFPDETPEMAAARRAFAARHGHDARHMIDAIRYRGGLDALRGTPAEPALRELASRARMSESELEWMVRRREPGGHSSALEPSRPRRPGPLGLAFGALVVAIVVVGLVTVAGWGLSLLR